MKTKSHNSDCSPVAALVAPEDLRAGDFVALLSEIVEVPSFYWDGTLPCMHEPVRLRRLPTEDRVPLKIEAICLPFVFVKLPDGQFRSLDVRLAELVRLKSGYAKTVWKCLRKRPARRRSACRNRR